jgi:hypothetical protein
MRDGGAGLSDTERYADLYLNFVDNQDWLSQTFASMTMAEYHAFVTYFFEELNFAGEAKEGGEFQRVKGLILAMARKDLEVAHFSQGLTDEQRESSRRAATAYYELAKGFYSPDRVVAVEEAWATSLDHCARFGWPSAAFDLLDPRPIFKDG